MTEKLTKNYSQDLILNKILDEWVTNHIRPKPNAQIYLSEGRSQKRHNLHTCFCEYVVQKGIYDRVPKQKFLSSLQKLFNEKKLPFHKHRLTHGFILYGIEVID